MNILINCSNQHQGGAIQVIHSICTQLNQYPQHSFVLVLSEEQKSLVEQIKGYKNVKTYIYSMRDNLWSLITGHNKTLDGYCKAHKVDVVFTVFGIARWIPKCPHLCGFARAQLLLKDSPYLNNISWKTKALFRIQCFFFKRDAKYYYTENPYISELLPSILRKDAKVYTVTNYYNQIYDSPEKWNKNINLPDFDGVTILVLGIPYPHKNFNIIPEIASTFLKRKPEFKFRFVVTAEKNDFKKMNDKVSNQFIFLGKIPFDVCPHLYSQCNILLVPSLMECFTANYPEAMKMMVPIVTVDLEYAHGLCREAACYYESTNADAAANAIYKVATNKEYAMNLVKEGNIQLNSFDNYEQRTKKIINILEDIYTKDVR